MAADPVRACTGAAELALRAADHLSADPPSELEAIRCLRGAIAALTEAHDHAVRAVLASPDKLDRATRELMDQMGRAARDRAGEEPDDG